MAKKRKIKPASTPESVEPTRLDAAALASPVAGAAQLRMIRLEESHAKRAFDIATTNKMAEAKIEVLDGAFGESDDQEHFFFRMTLRATVTDADSGAESPLVDIMATYALFFDLQSREGISQENIVAFAQTSGMFIVWPYWREFVQSMSSRLGVPTIVVPIRRF